jgi:hypothetical protein
MTKRTQYRAQAPPPAAPPGDNVGDIIGVGGNVGVIGDGGGGGAEAVGGARGGRAVHGIVAVPPIAQVAAPPPPPNAPVLAAVPPVLPGIVGPANARAQTIANRCHLAAAAGNNLPPSVVDQEDVADMRRPRNRDNVEVIDAMQHSILQATNALTRAMEGRAQPPPPPPPAPQPLPFIIPPPAGQELGEQIDFLYKRLKAARETGMDASAVRYERQIADLEARDEELTRSRFLGNN